LKIARENVHANFGGECFPGDISGYVLLPTTARQVIDLANLWDSARKITQHYEFLIYTGEYKGIKITACSTGIGGVSTATATEELARLGAHTFIHLGLADPPINPPSKGELTIATGTVRYDGTSQDYVRPEYPALAHFEVVMAAISAAETMGQPYRVGITGSFASSGLEQPGKWNNEKVRLKQEQLENAGVFGGSGEEATIFIQSAIYKLRAGSVVGSPMADRQIEQNVLKTGLEATWVLAGWDQKKTTNNLPYIFPD